MLNTDRIAKRYSIPLHFTHYPCSFFKFFYLLFYTTAAVAKLTDGKNMCVDTCFFFFFLRYMLQA